MPTVQWAGLVSWTRKQFYTVSLRHARDIPRVLQPIQGQRSEGQRRVHRESGTYRHWPQFPHDLWPQDGRVHRGLLSHVQAHAEASEWHTFRVAYLSGVPWSVCHKRLNMLRTNFMQACYRLEAKLGRAFRETEPFGLYPLNEYFGTVVRGAHVAVIVPMVPRVVPVRPPMAAA